MCGVVAAAGLPESRVRQGVEALTHRGPDASGVLSMGGAVLGHTRLAILDLDARSNQPFRRGAMALSYNGELWNHGALRADLEASGAAFTTSGDTEVVAAAIERWGADAVPRFNGMFGMAWTDAAGGLWAARDRYGEVPLHWWQEGASVAVASERKALAVLGCAGERVVDVEPGEILHWARPGDAPERRRFGAIPLEPLAEDHAAAVAGVRVRLEAAVRERLIADVPVCVLLSGGIDSSAIAALIHGHLPRLVAYTAVLDPRSLDLHCARLVAQRFGIDLVEVPVQAPSADDLRRAVEVIEQPLAAQVQIAWPSLALAARMRADGFRVTFSGEGADELLGSYGFAQRALAAGADWHAYRRVLFLRSARANFPRANKAFLAHGVECRLPFLHQPLAEYLIGLTRSAVRGPGREKRVLQQAVADLVPDAVARRPKLAFQVGLGLRDDLRRRIPAAAALVREHYRACYGTVRAQARSQELQVPRPTNAQPRPDRPMPRYERLGRETVCSACGACPPATAGPRCESARTLKPRDYNGIRLTSDGFDCALPVTIDSHSICSYACAYCFSEQLQGHVDQRDYVLGQVRLTALERIFGGEGGAHGEIVRRALLHDARNEAGYPCPVQLGGINDPCDDIERQQGWMLRFAPLIERHRQPVRVSTKGTLLRERDYLDMLDRAPHLWWVAWSINTIDDELAAKVDRLAPPPSERLKTMAILAKRGVRTSLRMRPLYPGLSDATPKHPAAWAELIDRATEAGAYAISVEVGFVPTRFNPAQRERWQRMEALLGVPLQRVYGAMGKKEMCLRPAYGWTEELMHAIVGRARANGLQVGVSDPVWKQLSQHGCCCGMPADDPVWGNWSRRNATNALVRARDATSPQARTICFDDCCPEWADDIGSGAFRHMGVGPLCVWRARHADTWRGHLLGEWNDPKHPRSPLRYFQGALQPRVDGDVLVYDYVGLPRHGRAGASDWTVRTPNPAAAPPAPVVVD